MMFMSSTAKCNGLLFPACSGKGRQRQRVQSRESVYEHLWFLAAEPFALVCLRELSESIDLHSCAAGEKTPIILSISGTVCVCRRSATLSTVCPRRGPLLQAYKTWSCCSSCQLVCCGGKCQKYKLLLIREVGKRKPSLM